MEKVSGIGGVFFKAHNPEALAAWYEKHLGISPVPKSYDVEPWKQESGSTVFAPFDEGTNYFGRDSQQWMINFRVKDLAAMVKQLKNSGLEVDVDPEEYPNGQFARLYDPESNPVELWEPK